jgi:hypothetical protein
VPLAVAILALVVQQALVALRAFPPSAPITVSLAILASVGAILAALPAILAQYGQHALAMEQLRSQTTLAISARKGA